MSINDIFKTLEDSFVFKKEATVGGIKFVISLLNYEQEQQLNSFPDEGDSPLAFYDKTRAIVLSYAIKNINGQDIPDVVSVEKEGKTETKEKAIYLRDFIKKIPTAIVEKLFEIYIDFKEETEKKLNETVKYAWYMTPEQRDKKGKNLAAEASTEEKITEESDATIDKPIAYTKIEEKEEDSN